MFKEPKECLEAGCTLKKDFEGTLANLLSITLKVKSYFLLTVIQVAKVQGLLLVQRQALDMRHHLAVSCSCFLVLS